MTLTAFRTPVQNGLMQKVNIFWKENKNLHAFYAPTKNPYKLDKGIMLFVVSEKKWPLLLAKGVVCSKIEQSSIFFATMVKIPAFVFIYLA